MALEAFISEGPSATEVIVPSEVRFAIVRKMLEDAGWLLARVRGHHHVFTKPGRRSLPIVVERGKVRPVYVRLAEKACQEQEDEGRH